jgi:alpha-glucoside transport system permease protein
MRSRHPESKKSIFLYFWVLPAVILVGVFLVLPSFQTIVLSFTQEIRFSEEDVKREIGVLLPGDIAGKSWRETEVGSIPGYEKIITEVESRYGLKLTHEYGRGKPIRDLTIMELAELVVLGLYKRKSSMGEQRTFAGFANFARMFVDNDMIGAFRNNALWLVAFTFFAVVLGLFIAKLIDRVRWATAAKSVVFIPMSISYVASGVIWTFMYAKDPNMGTVNAVAGFACRVFAALGSRGAITGYEPVAFLGRPETVNIALIAATLWIWCGFCVVIFTAALNGIPQEIVEASRIDGADAVTTFFRIEVPVIGSTITVVTTTMIINVLKIFDIVYTMTGGGPSGASEVIANRMYRTAFNTNDIGYASAMAVVLFLAVVPVMVFNITRFIREAIR